MSYLQTVADVYAEAARRPDSELCCVQSPVWQLPDLVIPPIMVEMNYGCGSTVNPRDLKLRLARELAARFHGDVAAETAVAGWNAAVRGEGDTATLPLNDVPVPAEGLRIAALLTAAGLTPSNSEANRKLKERAVRIDGEVVEDAQRVLAPGFEGVLAVGKRTFARIRLVQA